MKLFTKILIGVVIVSGISAIVSITYIIPLFLMRTPEQTNTATGTETPSAQTLQETPEPVSTASAAQGPVFTIKPFTRTMTKEGKPELEIRAEKARFDQETKQYQLYAIEKIEFWGENDIKINVKADEGKWNQDKNQVTLNGQVKGVIEKPGQDPVHIACDWLKYDKDLGRLVGGSTVKIDMKHYHATGDKLIVRPDIDHVELDENVVTRIDPEAFSSDYPDFKEIVRITAKNMVYNGTEEILQFSGNPVVQSKSNRISCKVIRVDLKHENTRVIFNGNCSASLKFPQAGSTDDVTKIAAGKILLDLAAGELRMDENIHFIQGKRKLFALDRVSLLLDQESRKFYGGEANGRVRFSDQDFSGGAEDVSWDPVSGMAVLRGRATLSNRKDIRVYGETIQLNTTERFYVVEENAEIVLFEKTQSAIPKDTALEPEESENEPVDLQANDMVIEPTATPLDETPVTAKPATPERKNIFSRFQGSTDSDKEPMRIQTKRIELDETEGRMVCLGDVRGEQGTFRFSATDMELLFDPGTREIISLTARENVSMSDRGQVVSGGRFYYDHKTGNAEIWENPVMWRGDGQIRAKKFIYNEISGLLTMRDDVEAVTTFKDDSDKDQTIHLTAGNGSYDEVSGGIEFQDNVKMDWDVWKTTSDSLRMETDKETGELLGADALGKVKIDHEEFTATGHSLTYNAETSILILRGTSNEKCQVTQGDRGSQGDEIRFFLNDNRFVIDKGMSMIMPSEMTGTLNE